MSIQHHLMAPDFNSSYRIKSGKTGFLMAFMFVALSACSDQAVEQNTMLRDAYSESRVLEPPEQLQRQLEYWRSVGVDAADYKGLLFVATFAKQKQFADLSYQMWLTAEGLWSITIDGDEVVIRELYRDRMRPFESAYASMYFKAEALGGLVQFQSISDQADQNIGDEQRLTECCGEGTLMEEKNVVFWKQNGAKD